MTPLLPAHRAAEEFDEVLAGRAAADVAERHAPLMRTVQALRAAPTVAPRPEFALALRERLMAAAATELTPAAEPVRTLHEAPSRRRHRRAGSLAAALVIVGGSAGVAAAASGALPGDPLYPIKRGMEQVDTAVRVGDAAEGRALLGNAAERLEEVQQLVAAGDADPQLVASTLEDFHSQADAGADKLFVAFQAEGDPADIQSVRDFTTSQMSVIDDLARTVGPQGFAPLVDVADTLADIDQQARVLCSTCGPESTVAPPQALASGAGAASVQNLITRPARQAQLDVAVADRLRALRHAAQGAAGQQGSSPSTNGTGSGTTQTTQPASKGPVRSTISQGGALLPVLGEEEPVKGLVKGVTSSLKSSGDAVKDVTDDVTGAVQDTVDGVTKGLQP